MELQSWQRRAAEILDPDNLRQRLAKGDKLRIKLGIDPNKPDLHLGHTVPLRALRHAQDQGHTAVLILGDYTAQLGDPSDRSESRKLVSADETARNADLYVKQVFAILDPSRAEVRRNSEWFGAFSLRDIIELMAKTTVNHLLSHETFHARLNGNLPLYAHEMLYPLMQGYDSVMVKADVEIGAIDQKFNMLMGRTLQRAYGQSEQNVICFDYLPGTDGAPKMSKSLGNTINISDSPDEMFGKVMSLPDSLMEIFFRLATDIASDEYEGLLRDAKSHRINPRDVKVALAKAVVEQFYSRDAAQRAAQEFDRRFRLKEQPDDMPSVRLAKGTYPVVEILTTRAGLVGSKSEARRLIEQGAVRLNGQLVASAEATVSPSDGKATIQIGPRRWVRVEWN